MLLRQGTTHLSTAVVVDRSSTVGTLYNSSTSSTAAVFTHTAVSIYGLQESSTYISSTYGVGPRTQQYSSNSVIRVLKGNNISVVLLLLLL